MYVTSATDTVAATATVATTVSAVTIFQATANGARSWEQFRLVPTLNTNVTYRAELYAGENI